jgi:alpha-beta hydrolase superfamily lysophospholipase/SAM-dependent methyltransferase
VFAWDERGHGLSPGERGGAESLSVVIRDAEAFARHVAETHGVATKDTVVLAHSVGAVVAVAWVHDYAPPIRGLILGVPAFRVKLYVPFAVPLLRLRQKLFGPGHVKSYVKAKMLTHDAEQAAAYEADQHIFRQIAVNILLDLYDTSTRLLADAGAITVPTLVLEAGADWVVKRRPQQQFVRGISSQAKRLVTFPGFHHAIFHEKGRERVVAAAKEFILECFQREHPRSAFSDADKNGYTKREYDRLLGSGNIFWALQRGFLKTVGKLSEGIRLGWRSGFDSGVTLDYVYENQPRGSTPLGRFIDRQYLESPGWRGIRHRRAHLEAVLRETIQQSQARSGAVRLLDVASGPGRYVLETLRTLNGLPVSAVLHDYKPENLEAARRMAEQMGLGNVTFQQGDAFDEEALAGISPRPTLAIVSGLYELFPENAPVRRSLRGLARAIEPGGHLIYTNQPWHPQLEFIARVLTNREGKPWVMRCRTQAEMDELVRDAGFEKIRQEIDPAGIFTVSVARRRGT